jgi:hypothetical protein
MGAFFTNVHVRSPAGAEAATRTAILELIPRLVAEKGLVPCADGETPDRSIVVGAVGAWIGVFDEITESQNVKLLDALAKALSEATSRPALAALVHDSDHLLLRLFEGGKLVDEVDRGKKKGKLDLWSRLVAPDKAEALRAAFAAQDLFAEQTLGEIAGLLGIDAASACTGHTYLVEEAILPGATRMLFQHAVRPRYEQPAEGPPRMQTFPAMISQSLAVGGVLHLSHVTHNDGGPVRNFYVAVHGSAIEAGLVEVEKIRIMSGLRPERGGADFEAQTVRRTTNEGKAALVADFPEGTLPASNAGGTEALAGLGPKESLERFMRSNVSVTVSGKAISAGEGELYLSVVPREAREHAGHAGFRLTVVPTPRKPLRGKVEDLTHYLPVFTPDALVALAVSTLEKEEAAPIAAEIVERWSKLWPPEAKLQATLFDGGLATRRSKPRTATLTVGKLAKNATWKKLRAAFATANCVGAEPKIEPMFSDRLRGGNGFGFGGRLVEPFVQPVTAEDRDAPTLRLIVMIRGRTDVPEVVGRARALVDEFVKRARCCQAVLTRCSPGRGTYLLDHSPYEDVCGIHGQYTLHRRWGTRFLRSVGADGIWLGPNLLARVDRRALESLCDAESVGDTLRLVLHEGATLDALEGALAPVLASEQDWNDAAERYRVEVRNAREP